jgi:WD40 repeat protein
VWGGGFSPDGTRIVTTSSDGTARVWDAATGQVQLTLTGHTGWVRGGGFSPDGTRIVTAGDDGTARVWDAATGQQTGWELQHLPDGELSVWSVPDRRLLGATPGAWRWLGYVATVDGVRVVLPAETPGPLPALTSPGSDDA